MSDIVKPTDYSDRDFDSIYLRLQQMIQSVFPQWTDWTPANFGVILLKSFSFGIDILTYYEDNQAREGHFVTAQQRRNLLKLVQWFGYVPAGATAASVDIKITLEAVPIGSVTFPAGTEVQTNDVTPIVFQLLTAAVIGAGANPPTITAAFEQSETTTDTFTSTGRANQEHSLTDGPFLQNTLAVTAANGAYTPVLSLLGSGPTDRHYQVLVDHNELATIRFGDGINGRVPSGTITAVYRVGGGTIGNVEAAAITKMNGSFTDSLSNPVNVGVTNLEKASGGSNRLTNAQIRALGPQTLRVLTRTVSREDFEINAKRVPGIARALFLTSHEDSNIPENTGYLYAVPAAGGQPSSLLRADLLQMVTEIYPTMATFTVVVAGSGAPTSPGNVPYKTVNVQATVTLRASTVEGFDQVVKQRILDNLATYFAATNEDGTENTNIDFGYKIQDGDGSPLRTIFRSDIFNIIRDTDGVQSVELSDFLLNGSAADVLLALAEFPVLGSSSLYNKATGGLL